ncbi:unnamed protein product, partial [marine sediment metagenome]
MAKLDGSAPIEDVLNDLLLKNSYISKKTKDSISKII